MSLLKPLLGLALGASAVPVFGLTAEYRAHFEGRWTPDLPTPNFAHFTQFVGGTHNASGSLLSVGQAASPGVEQTAELGGTFVLRTEVEQQIDAGNADGVVLGSPIFIGPQVTDTFTFPVNDQFPLLTLISMIAPSPDWFLGVHDLSLVDQQGDFIPRIVIDLASYDAGTEDGIGFSLDNPSTNPRGVITPLDVAEPNNPLFGAGSIGRLTLTLVLPGDLDGDGDVDGVDLSEMFSNFTGPNNGPPTNPDADLDGDNDVDGVDLSQAFSAFTGPFVPAAAAVPEPGTMGTLALIGLALVRRRRADS